MTRAFMGPVVSPVGAHCDHWRGRRNRDEKLSQWNAAGDHGFLLHFIAVTHKGGFQLFV